MPSELVEEIGSEAAISSRPGQLDRLKRLALRVEQVEADRDRYREGLERLGDCDVPGSGGTFGARDMARFARQALNPKGEK